MVETFLFHFTAIRDGSDFEFTFVNIMMKRVRLDMTQLRHPIVKRFLLSVASDILNHKSRRI